MRDDTANLRRLGAGREAEVFEWEGGTALRLLRDPRAGDRARAERAAMQAAAHLITVPQVFDVITVTGRPGTVMERINGADLLTLIERRPWTLSGVGARCGRLHARLLAADAPAGIPALKPRWGRELTESANLPAALLAPALRLLAELPDGDALCHGDLHPGNALWDGHRAVVIDWPGATRGDPLADLARSRILLTIGEPPPGASWLLRTLARFGRRLLLGAYERAVRAEMLVSEARLRQWEAVTAVHRLTEGIAAERAPLLRLIERRGLAVPELTV